MSRPSILPDACFVAVQTRRLARPELLWQHETAALLGFDPDRQYCVPTAGDALEAYASEARVEWADRYGGTGIAAGGGAGRCAAYGNLETKGVGPTPLVAHDADVHHSSGEQNVTNALAEALFAQVFQAALPFGAVPALAVSLVYRGPNPELSPSARALTVRPFVLRPAHFMRNVLHQQQHLPQGSEAPGLSRDAYRVTQALRQLTQGFGACLGITAVDDVESIDQGLRELGRRLAWQFAASFAKRLPHGGVTCSNVSLAGEFLDYGMSHALPTYRRPANALQDPWTEYQRPLVTLWTLRQQLDKYFPGLRGTHVVAADELCSSYRAVFEERLAIEMAKMAGLTEDLAGACPKALLADWLSAMRGVWRHGGRECLPARDATTEWSPLPIDPKRPDLNRVLAAAAPHEEPEVMDQTITPLLGDPTLRRTFVNAAVVVRQALRSTLGSAGGSLSAYLSAQATRKNSAMFELERDSWFRIGAVAKMFDADFQPASVQILMRDAVGHARHVLADLAPGMVGKSGIEQIQVLAQQTRPVPLW